MAESFRDFEHAGWADPEVCASYDAHLSRLTTQSIEPLLDAAGVGPDSRVLDVATGAGYAAGAALARGADVTGTDFSAEQVRLARQRYPAATFLEGDAGNLPFADGSFDAVVSNYGVLHFPEPDRFFREAFRVLKAEGRLAFAIWDAPQEAKLFSAVLGAITANGSLDVGLPAGPNMFLFTDAAVCRKALEAAGFENCTVSKVAQIWRPSSPEELLHAVKTGTVRVRGTLTRQRAEALQAIDEAILAALAPFKKESGYEIPMPAVLATASKG
jgi:ubiquinone/menaquinone biosynthesis C-methylase UbiE